MIHSSNNLYGQRAFLGTELSHTSGCANTKLAAQVFNFEKNASPLAAADSSHTTRLQWTKELETHTCGKLAIDFFSCDQHHSKQLNTDLIDSFEASFCHELNRAK